MMLMAQTDGDIALQAYVIRSLQPPRPAQVRGVPIDDNSHGRISRPIFPSSFAYRIAIFWAM